MAAAIYYTHDAFAKEEELFLDQLMLLYPEDVLTETSSEEKALHWEIAQYNYASLSERIHSDTGYVLQHPRHAVSIVNQYALTKFKEIDPYAEIVEKFIIRCEPYLNHILNKAKRYYHPALTSSQKQALILDFSSALCEEETHSLQPLLEKYKTQISWLGAGRATSGMAEIGDIKQFLKLRIISLLGACLSAMSEEGSLFLRQELKAALISYRIAHYQNEHRRQLLISAPVKEVITACLESFLEGLINGIKHASVGESIVFPLYWEGHAVGLEIKKEAIEKVKMYVHNYDPKVVGMHVQSSEGSFFPYWVHGPDDGTTHLEPGGFEYEYLKDIVFNTFSMVPQRVAVPIIYPLTVGPLSYDPSTTPSLPQAHADCVSYSFGRARSLTPRRVAQEISHLNSIWQLTMEPPREGALPFAEAQASSSGVLKSDTSYSKKPHNE